ncbi:hypothetical protein LR48_Vigan04g174700 [Vigna angularis]|uniref:Uncharacterized protein n=1 Tax=Phaseolus angularis TaxID=3914 RepID=A0A0L9UG80_PHAAN|nr:hypothetical protein LR48_Vigan04g174700 [Vigna angularis]
MNMESSTSQFPVSQLNFSREINGNETEIIISRYEDHFLVSADGVVFYVFMVIVLTFLAAYQVIATQIGTMGTIVYARKEEGVSINPTFNVSVIFGKRDENVLMQPMLVACARQLIEQMSLSGSSRPLVLSLGLKDHSVETLKGIVSAVTDNSMW